MSGVQLRKYHHRDTNRLLTYDDFKKQAIHDVKMITLVALILLALPGIPYLIFHFFSPHNEGPPLLIATLIIFGLPFVIYRPYMQLLGFLIFARKPK